MYESTGWSTHANSRAIYLKSAPICVTFKSLPDIKSSVWLQENWSRLGNPAGLVDSVADFFVGAACGVAPIGSMSRSAPPPAAPTRPLDTDVTCLHGPPAPQAACHGLTPHWWIGYGNEEPKSTEMSAHRTTMEIPAPCRSLSGLAQSRSDNGNKSSLWTMMTLGYLLSCQSDHRALHRSLPYTITQPGSSFRVTKGS